MDCPVCSRLTMDFGELQVRGRHLARYRRCPDCDFIFVVNPTWLEEAYAGPLTASDVGGVDRNLRFARSLRAIIEGFFDHHGRFIDYGGGTGLLTRLMRDAGYDFYWHDSHCPNLYAEGFVADMSGASHYELLTAVEVLEHLPDPLAALCSIAGLADNLLFATQLLPEPPPRPGEWWYYGPEHGQHISFFGRRTLALLAEKHSMSYVTNGQNLHLFSTRRLSPIKFKLLTWDPVVSVVGTLCRRPSRLPLDFKSQRDAGQG